MAVLMLLSVQSVSADEHVNIDPLEPLNRKVHNFNMAFDALVFKPLAYGYKAATPDFVEAGVGNFFSNIGDVGVLINNLLQLKFDDAAVDFARITFNTTIGLGGLIDVSSVMGLEKHHEDFGQTLGVWGVPAGPYLVLPFFGPGSARDSSASFVPLDAWMTVTPPKTRNIGYMTRLVDNRAKLFKFESLISGDNYIFIRDAYLGARQQAVTDGIDEVFNEDDF
ncbi:MAG: VacJ family lipoprotein [Oceanospirillaceae bacterium]|nr:VacJ family lipoprotein [Oceanospirillaceae bacterium]